MVSMMFSFNLVNILGIEIGLTWIKYVEAKMTPLGSPVVVD